MLFGLTRKRIDQRQSYQLLVLERKGRDHHQYISFYWSKHKNNERNTRIQNELHVRIHQKAIQSIWSNGRGIHALVRNRLMLSGHNRKRIDQGWSYQLLVFRTKSARQPFIHFFLLVQTHEYERKTGRLYVERTSNRVDDCVALVQFKYEVNPSTIYDLVSFYASTQPLTSQKERQQLPNALLSMDMAELLEIEVASLECLDYIKSQEYGLARAKSRIISKKFKALSLAYSTN